MGFNLIDPNEGNFGHGQGRKPLENIVRVNVGKTGVARITISQDICNEYGLKAGDRLNVLLGTDEDYGSFCLAPTSLSDTKGYSIFSGGPKARALAISLKANKLYNVVGTFDCIVTRTKRAVVASIPASALPSGITRNVAITNGSHEYMAA